MSTSALNRLLESTPCACTTTSGGCLRCQAEDELHHLRSVYAWAADAQEVREIPVSKLARLARWLRQFERAPEHEIRIIDLLIDRLARGRGTYGPGEATDGRDHPAEALEEVVDALHYCAAELLRLGHGEREG